MIRQEYEVGCVYFREEFGLADESEAAEKLLELEAIYF